MNNTSICVIGDGFISYTGQDLRMDDQDVYNELIHRARNTNVKLVVDDDDPPTISFTPYNFCKALGWRTSGHYYTKLENTITRLSATDIQIESKRLGERIGASLVRKRLIRDSKNSPRLKYWSVWLEPEILKLFDHKYLSSVANAKRLKLKPLEKWLHTYYQSHRTPYPLKVETIHRGCGSVNQSVSEFQKDLIKSLKGLQRIDFLKSHWINKGLVYVERK